MRQIDQNSINILYTMLLVSLPTEQIDKDFTQSYWLALQFVPTKKNKPDFYRGMPQASHGKSIAQRNSVMETKVLDFFQLCQGQLSVIT